MEPPSCPCRTTAQRPGQGAAAWGFGRTVGVLTPERGTSDDFSPQTGTPPLQGPPSPCSSGSAAVHLPAPHEAAAPVADTPDGRGVLTLRPRVLGEVSGCARYCLVGGVPLLCAVPHQDKSCTSLGLVPLVCKVGLRRAPTRKSRWGGASDQMRPPGHGLRRCRLSPAVATFVQQ